MPISNWSKDTYKDTKKFVAQNYFLHVEKFYKKDNYARKYSRCCEEVLG